MRPDLVAALEALKGLVVGALTSDRPTRLVEAYKYGTTAQKLIQTASIRVEDFASRTKGSKYMMYKNAEYDDVVEVAVPTTLGPDQVLALGQLTQVMLTLMESTKGDRFAEMSRVSIVAQQFIAAIVPKKEAGKAKSENVLDLRNMHPEDLYLAAGNNNPDDDGENIGYSDTTELQENYLRRKSANSQAVTEVSQAAIAESEAGELKTLMGLDKESPELGLKTRIEQLLKRIELRAQGRINAVVSTNISRRHQSNAGGLEHDDSEGNPPDGHGAERDGEAPQEGPWRDGGQAMDDGGQVRAPDLANLHAE